MEKDNVAKPIVQMNILETFVYAWKRIFNFTGRASRKEYWTLVLGNAAIIVSFFLAIVLASENNMFFWQSSEALLLIPIASIILLVFIAHLSAAVRRLHDTNKSGFMWFITLIPFGGFVLLIFYLQASYPYENKWGLNPYTSETLLEDMDIFKQGHEPSKAYTAPKNQETQIRMNK